MNCTRMKEIGGYIEVEYYKGKMLYDDGVKINCGMLWNTLYLLRKLNGY